VETAPNKGATVRAHDAEDLDDLYRLRALLEGYAAGRAATKMEPEHVAELFASCERFEALADGDVAPLVKENMHFHSTIVDAAASGRVAELVRKVIELPLVYRSYIWYSPEQRRISAHYHRQVVGALRARDSDRAQLIMKEHIYEARDLLVAHLRHAERVGAAEGR
jgi:DNA-binding GntR family transcriptional regulator